MYRESGVRLALLRRRSSHVEHAYVAKQWDVQDTFLSSCLWLESCQDSADCTEIRFYSSPSFSALCAVVVIAKLV